MLNRTLGNEEAMGFPPSQPYQRDDPEIHRFTNQSITMVLVFLSAGTVCTATIKARTVRGLHGGRLCQAGCLLSEANNPVL